MPTTRKAKDLLNAKRSEDDKPRKDDTFGGSYTWAEFQLHEVNNKDQVKVDFAKPDQIWHYLGKPSTEARAQYTEDPSKPRHNPRGNFMDTVPKIPKFPKVTSKAVSIAKPQPQQSYGYGVPPSYGQQYNAMRVAPVPPSTIRADKPYVYKPRKPMDIGANPSQAFTSQRFTPMSASPAPRPQAPTYPQYPPAGHQGYQNPTMYSAQRFEVKGPPNYMPQQSVPQSHLPTNVAARPVQHQWTQPLTAPSPPGVAQYAQRPVAPVFYNKAPPAPAPAPAPVVVPMSAPKQPGTQVKPQWQVHQSIYERYPFFYVNYNR